MENGIMQREQQQAAPAREIGVVTAEIKEICRQARNMALMYAIEIGRRLVEAKSVLNHGEWGDWLKNEVNFSQSTANNFMKLFNEYGSEQISFFGAVPNSQTFANLPYTKALQLLSLPADERETFVEESDAESMTVRELQAAIKERNEAREAEAEARCREAEILERAERAEAAAAAAEQAAEEAEQYRSQVQKLEEDLKAAEERTKKANEKLRAAKNNPKIPAETMNKIKEAARAESEKEAAKKLEAARKAAEDAEAKYRDAERRRAIAERDLEEAQRKLKTASPEVTEFKALFDEIQRTAKAMKEKVSVIASSDPETAEKLKAALSAFGKSL